MLPQFDLEISTVETKITRQKKTDEQDRNDRDPDFLLPFFGYVKGDGFEDPFLVENGGHADVLPGGQSCGICIDADGGSVALEELETVGVEFSDEGFSVVCDQLAVVFVGILKALGHADPGVEIDAVKGE